ncbi:hypothetical protein PV396_43380 [Streptomyces sp. ME02-8801-2C]|uniref:hypothetical protein n=1 Tax=Streptomyces sp. ME02-8801-2C TaxID=3028680 RepID=UPI0029A5CC8D|nr:hypothetical protein [Streptomyces sp. ME02-8801-2C]MDX3458695.1 hypothetical protein [Streptomyces sp. ME02-8801-2C]
MADGEESRGLVTQSLLRGADLALNGSLPLSLAAFADLCTLCEALVLFDQVEALESADRNSVGLADRLTGEGLYRTFHPTLSRDDMRRLLLRMPAELAARAVLPPEQQRRPPSPRPVAAHRDVPATLDEVVAQVDRSVRYHSAGEEESERAYRSNGYLIVAAAHGLDYFPDSERAAFTAGTLKKVYRSLPVELYERVAASLSETLNGGDIASEWDAISTIPIPPVSALVLHRAASLADVPDEILRVRDEFASYRKYFVSFKADMAAADTIKERKGLRKKYQLLLAAASGPDQESVSLAGMLNLSQSVVAAAAAPAVATSYGALLLTQPVEWIHTWWRRRPLAILLRMDSKLPRLSVYRGLVGKLWGAEAGATVLDQVADRAYRQSLSLLDDGTPETEHDAIASTPVSAEQLAENAHCDVLPVRRPS